MSERYQRMRQQVAEAYARNRQRGRARWCGYEYDFVCPSTGTYPFQWFWDSCFHAITLTHFDLDRARAEILSLLANAQPDGLIAHVTFWQRERYEAMLSTYAIAYRTPYLSDCIQPPLLAEAVAAIAGRGGDLDFARRVMPVVRRYYDYLHQVRDPDRDGLISVLQADETGLDHSPKFDAYLGLTGADPAAATAAWHRVADPYEAVGRDPKRMFELDRFNVEDVMVNTIYAENQRALADLYRRLDQPREAEEMEARARSTGAAILAKCWDPQERTFFDLAGRDEQMLRTHTVTSLFPLLLPELPADRALALATQLEDPRGFAAEFPVPTVAIREPGFAPGVVGTNMVWRGATWINANWYLARGLRRHGFGNLADRIATQSAALVEKHGLREYYDCFTGEGFGARDFSWTGLALDMIAPDPTG